MMLGCRTADVKCVSLELCVGWLAGAALPVDLFGRVGWWWWCRQSDSRSPDLGPGAQLDFRGQQAWTRPSPSSSSQVFC